MKIKVLLPKPERDVMKWDPWESEGSEEEDVVVTDTEVDETPSAD